MNRKALFIIGGAVVLMGAVASIPRSMMAPEMNGRPDPKPATPSFVPPKPTPEMVFLASLTENERQAWRIWRETFIETSASTPEFARVKPETWLPTFLETREKVVEMGARTPLVYVLQVDAQERMQFNIALIQYAEGSKENQIRQVEHCYETAKRWQKCFKDMRVFAE